MAIFPRELPPAGTPVPLKVALAGLLRSGKAGAEATAFEKEVASWAGCEAACLVSSGRTALVTALRLLGARAPGKSAVVVPAYTCYSVAASVVRAGFQVVPVDIDPATLSYRKDALEAAHTKDAFAILSANLFGSPDDLPWIERYALERGLFMVDDAAQAMGARIDGRAAGTFGDLGLFSLDKGKNITTIQGGLLLVNRASFVDEVQAAVSGLPPAPAHVGMADRVRLLAYAALLHPTRYVLPATLLPLGRTPFDTDFPVRGYPIELAAVGRALFAGLERLNELRSERANWLREELSTIGQLALPGSKLGSGVALRLPVLLGSEQRRDLAVESLRREGLGGSRFYPKALPDVPELALPEWARRQPFEGARIVASGLLTLPTHPYVSESDVRRMGEVLRRLPT